MTNEIIPLFDDLSDEELGPLSNSFDNLTASAEWQAIVGDVLATLDEYEAHDDVIKATEYMICGFPLYKISEKLQRSPDTIRGWLERYPAMAKAVRLGQRRLHMWRMARLEQQFLDAINTSEEIINLPVQQNLDDDNPIAYDQKLVATLATHARFIINLFVGQKLDIQIRDADDNRPVLNVEKDALEYLAEALQGKRDVGPVVEGQFKESGEKEVTYKVIDRDTTTGPLFDKDGNPIHGELGVIDKDEDGVLCHICGKRVPKLNIHVTQGHKMKQKEYRTLFMIPEEDFKNA